MNLYRWVKGLGLIPRVMATSRASRIPTALHDPAGLGGAVGQNPGDGDELCRRLEDQLRADDCANATGFGVRSRGCPEASEYRGDIMQIGNIYDIDELRRLGASWIDVSHAADQVDCLAEHPILSSSIT